LIILIIHIIVSYDKNISLIIYVKDGSHVRLRHPSCVSITAQWQYTAVQKCVHLRNNFPCIKSLIECRNPKLRFKSSYFGLGRIYNSMHHCVTKSWNHVFFIKHVSATRNLLCDSTCITLCQKRESCTKLW